MSDEFDIELLDRLNAQQLAKVIKLIHKLASKNGDDEAPKKLPARLPQKIADTEVYKPRREAAPTRPENNRRKQSGGRPQGGGKPPKSKVPKYSVPAELDTSGNRDNEFERMPKTHDDQDNPAYAHINDKAKPPTRRGTRGPSTDTVICCKCHYEYTVPVSLIRYEHNKPKFTCNDCILTR